MNSHFESSVLQMRDELDALKVQSDSLKKALERCAELMEGVLMELQHLDARVELIEETFE